MRYALARTGLLLVLLAAAGHAADDVETAPAGRPAVQETTRIEGTVPDLTGRWLVVAEVALPDGGGTVVPTPQLWDVRAENGKTTLALRSARLPAPLLDAVAASNAQHRGWEPSIADLRRVRDEWQALAPDDRGLAAVDTAIIGRDAFSDATKADEKMRDARFVIEQTLNYRPAPGSPIREMMLHGVTETMPLGYRGNYASVTIAAAPFPVTIPFAGTFRMYRLESVSPPGLLARLLDAFAGCGRRSR